MYINSFEVHMTLIPFTPDNCDLPVAMVSPDLPDYIKNVINDNWDKVSSGLGSHTYVEELLDNETDPDIIQEYWEEYSL